MRRDADQALDEHELPTVVHLVLLRAHEILQPALGILSHRVGEGLVEEIVGERLFPSREGLSALFEERDDPRFVERLALLGPDSRHQSAEVVPFERRELPIAVKVIMQEVDIGDVPQHLAHRAHARCGYEVVPVLRDLAGDLQGVAADRAKRIRQLFRAVLRHEFKAPRLVS